MWNLLPVLFSSVVASPTTSGPYTYAWTEGFVGAGNDVSYYTV